MTLNSLANGKYLSKFERQSCYNLKIGLNTHRHTTKWKHKPQVVSARRHRGMRANLCLECCTRMWTLTEASLSSSHNLMHALYRSANSWVGSCKLRNSPLTVDFLSCTWGRTLRQERSTLQLARTTCRQACLLLRRRLSLTPWTATAWNICLHTLTNSCTFSRAALYSQCSSLRCSPTLRRWATQWNWASSNFLLPTCTWARSRQNSLDRWVTCSS